ncbi:hypothetical protein EDM00_08120 [Ornithobacterium rhinotracheale]|uniref:hypothetical protein n=1 Tax=Ornithobacterium rhinotracheale TaxID=28251 RepID=UPI00129CA171|nr:hypothetical protein [Ornithobacterium rhinotracheale]MRI63951.1 hypothetical protein [Ornithobacterium rhinotracheale]
MKVNKLISVFLVFCSFSVFGQKTDFQNLKSDNQALLIAENQDSIQINGETYYFKMSPISYLKGNATALCNKPLNKNYYTNWRVEQNQLYISKITPVESYCGENFHTEKNEIAREKIAQFTNSEYNKKGLLPAKWVNGEFLVYKFPINLNEAWTLRINAVSRENEAIYQKSIANQQEVWVANFKNGSLVSFKRDKNIENKLKKALNKPISEMNADDINALIERLPKTDDYKFAIEQLREFLNQKKG